jgi:hypothetical protein
VLISDFANQMGCHIDLKPGVTAITFVALGTSLPDLFASKQAAIEDKTADNSIGNVTGSNCVNVFFGLGFPWTMSAIAWAIRGADDEWYRRYGHLPHVSSGDFVVQSGNLGFSVSHARPDARARPHTVSCVPSAPITSCAAVAAAGDGVCDLRHSDVIRCLAPSAR